MNFFKPEDFDWNIYEFEKAKYILIEKAATIANAKLEREGIKVMGKNSHWGELPIIQEGFFTLTIKGEHPNKKALLINIEEIEKCKHPKEKVRLIVNAVNIDPILQAGYSVHPDAATRWGSEFKCECGAKLKPASYEEV